MTELFIPLLVALLWLLVLAGLWYTWRWYQAWEVSHGRLYDQSAPVTLVSETDLREMTFLRRWLYRAGYRQAAAPRWFLVATGLTLVAGAALAGLVITSGVQDLMVQTISRVPGGTGEVFLPMAYLAPWFLGLTLALLPWLIVRQSRRDRVQKMDQDLPLVLELLSTLSEAGLGFDAALSRILETRLSTRPLARELRGYQADVLAGRPRSDCLRRLAWRCDIPGVSILSSALVQADQIGMGIAEVLRRQADDMRIRRREKANMFALSLATKRMFPLVICFLPGLFVWTLGPVFIQLIQMADAFIQVRDF